MNKKLSPQQEGLLKVLTPTFAIISGIPFFLVAYLLEIRKFPDFAIFEIIVIGVLMYTVLATLAVLVLLLVRKFLKWKWGIDNTKSNLSVADILTHNQTDAGNSQTTTELDAEKKERL